MYPVVVHRYKNNKKKIPRNIKLDYEILLKETRILNKKLGTKCTQFCTRGGVGLAAAAPVVTVLA